MCTHVSHAKICWQCTPDDIAEIIRAAKIAYYAGEPTMTDVVFDYLEMRLREQEPTHPALAEVGAKQN